MKKTIRIFRKWISSNKFVLFLTFVGILILGVPLLIFGVQRSFYVNIDPDVVYTTNALLYTKARVISYFDHPGTPSIVLFSYSFIPLRLISKYVMHQAFIQWAFDNYTLLTFYLRISQLILSGITLCLFLNVVLNATKSRLITFMGFLLVFLTGILSWSTFVSPESLSLFLGALWLFFFYRFVKQPTYWWNFVLVCISGMAFANKFTNLFLFIPALFLPFFIVNKNIFQRIMFVFLNLGVYISVFLIGVSPILYNFKYIVGWARSLFTHAEKYGGGINSIFHLETYLNSIRSQISSDPFTFLIVLLTLALIVGLVCAKKISKNDWVIVYLFFTSFLGFLIFAKYPSIHYNYVNILLIIFCGVLFINRVKSFWIKVILPPIVIIFLFSVNNYFNTLQKSVLNNQTASVVNVLESWTPFWSSDIFKEQLEKVKIQ